MSTIIALLALVGLLSGSGGVVTGHSLYYAQGQMERVYRVRIAQGLVAAGWHGSLAAVPDCRNIGRVVTARINGGAWTNYLIVDCAETRDYALQVRTGRVIEVDYWSAYRNGFVSRGRAPATVVYGGGK